MKVAKLVVAALAAGATTLVSVLSDNAFTSSEVVVVALAVLSALGVYAVPNKQ